MGVAYNLVEFDDFLVGLGGVEMVAILHKKKCARTGKFYLLFKKKKKLQNEILQIVKRNGV